MTAQQETMPQPMAETDRIHKRVDENGDTWRKVYIGGGIHCQNWIDQFKELGEIEVEEVDPKGFRCFEETGEKLFRIWLKMDPAKLDDLY